MTNYLLTFIQRIGYGFGFGLGMSFAWKINSMPKSRYDYNITDYKTQPNLEKTNNIFHCNDK